MSNKNKKKIESFEQLANAQQHKRPAAPEEEPAISTMLDEFEMWMALNWKKAIIGVCAFAVLVSIMIIIQGAIQRAELAARRELANAGSIAELEAAIAKHPGNKAADYARLRLAGELMQHFRNLLVCQTLGGDAAGIEATPDQIKTLQEQAKLCPASRLFRVADQLAAVAGPVLCRTGRRAGRIDRLHVR